MNITEFAEQVVFGTTLEDKLLEPGRLTEDLSGHRGPVVRSVVSPGRPIGLQMQQSHIGVKPPRDDQLENESARGQLLHFLANHELLATELMALVLLKFPDAPTSFRRGILGTLKEEQEHTRLYIRRMKECGIEFGSFPVSGHFWRMIEPMQSPIDFVSRLSLTFEQANLDYSWHFAQVFRNLGDEATASILGGIYEDEIGHVRHGLHWFRKWKDPELSDWDAYQSSLVFPMSPQRALGPRGTFNREGRKLAGLTDDFIDSIEVFRQSRGRTPTVSWFDPAAEAELGGELTPRERALMDQLGKDLELVMLPMAKQDDVILVRRLPSQEFCRKLINIGVDLPQFVELDERTSLSVRKLHEFSPWAWTPKNHEVARPLVASAHFVPEPWQEGAGNLYRKSWASERLGEWLSECDQPGELPGWFMDRECVGIGFHSRDELFAGLAKLAKRGFQSAIIKQDLASSGRGQRRLSCVEDLTPSDLAWLRSMFDLGSDTESVIQTKAPVGVIEPELDRLIDLSFLWHLPRDAETPRFLGWTRPWVTDGRRYCGTRLGTSLFDCDQRTKQFVLADRCSRIQTVVDWLQPRITSELVAQKFSGYFGVDALVCNDKNNDLKMKPLVELNPRMTLGHVALRLNKRLAPGTEAEFRILTMPEWEKLNGAVSDIPFEKAGDGRWKSGVVWLGEVDNHSKLVPVLMVGNQAIEQSRCLAGPCRSVTSAK